MNNVIQRKITSLTLMTIMVAGGMTIAFPGMEPAYAASELYVSAEKTGNFAGIQVIEIVVSDPERSSNDDSEGRPSVDINGNDVLMVQANDGAWYAYVANNLAITDYGINISDIYGTVKTDTIGTISSGSDAEKVFIKLDRFLDGSKSILGSETRTQADRITVDGKTIIAGSEWDVSGNDTIDATNLIKAIDDANLRVNATYVNGTFAITAKNVGPDGNDINVSSSNSNSIGVGKGKLKDGVDNVYATATITIDNPSKKQNAVGTIEIDGISAGNTVTIDSIIYTAVATAADVTNDQYFPIDSTNNRDAQALVDAINLVQSNAFVVDIDGEIITITANNAEQVLTITSKNGDEIYANVSNIEADSVTVDGETYTVDDNFEITNDDAENAKLLAKSINDKDGKTVTATSKGNVVTLTTKTIGEAGNDKTKPVSSTDERLKVKTFSGGVDEAHASLVIVLNDPLANTVTHDGDSEIRNNPSLTDKNHWPFIQTYDIASDSDVTITYGQGGTAERVEIEYDYDTSVDIKLDRQDYPKGAYVQFSLNDSLLNLSPTADDMWAFTTDIRGDTSVQYFIEDLIEPTLIDWGKIGFEEGPLSVSNNDDVLKYSDTLISKLIDETDKESVIIKQSDRDDNVFVNYDRKNQSGLTIDEVGEASLSYNNGHSVIHDAFVGIIEFATVNDEWPSGTEIEITLTDEDRNLDSRVDETMSIQDDEVPFIKIGNPLHLDDVIVDNTLIEDASKGSKTFTLDTQNNDFVHINFPVPNLNDVKKGYVFNYYSFDFTEIGKGKGIVRLTDDDIEDKNYHVDIDVDNNKVGVVYFDVLSFGQQGALVEDDSDDGNLKNNISRVNDAFYRLELEETADNSAKFSGTVEYIMINQLNVLEEKTYNNIETSGDTIVIIVNDDMDGTDAITVTYYDQDSTGLAIISTQEDANTHTGIISLDQETYSSGNTINVTLIDADLNTDSDTKQVYVIDETNQWIGNPTTWLVKLLIDDEMYTGVGCDGDYSFFETGLTLNEISNSSDTFEGSFALPALYCIDGELKNTNGLDLDVEYQDYSDSSGKSNETSASASIRSHTGSVSLDRTVYPPPFGFEEFATYGEDDFLDASDVVVTISVDDPDENLAASGTDRISSDTLKLEIHRDSSVLEINIDDSWLVETDPKSGIFEVEVTIPQDDYTDSKYNKYNDKWNVKDGRIYQGDILTVEYTDPQDASGAKNTVTDSATFDLRNAILQTDKSVYIIGSSVIITLIEPDLNMDSGTAETWSLDLINWDSDASRDLNLSADVFDANPSGLRETGDNTSIFQVVIEIPEEIGNDKLERGEQIRLEYNDQGPAGADFVGDDDEDIYVDIYTSNFGATISLDQKVYTWTDKVYITIVAPDHNFGSNVIDEIGADSDSEIKITSRSGDKLANYKLVETGFDTGIFTGEVILTGFSSHDADGDGESGDASGISSGRDGGPTNGMLTVSDDGGISVSFEFSDGETVTGSAVVRWNIGDVQWLEASYPASGNGVIRVIDNDMNLNPESVDSFDVTVWSDTVSGGISLRVTETNEATGIFEGTVFFTTTSSSSGSRLLVSEGDTVTAEYEDNTLPKPYSTADELDITATTIIGTLVPPLERAPAGNLRVVDAFGNSIGTVSVDQQVQIESDIVNNQDRDQPFAYLVQIQDNNGVTVSLSWITGELNPGQILTSSVSWIPENLGDYTAQVFVWKSIDNPSALSPPSSITVTVE